jgi:organic hydroperoxide reductase OsmC/OhrA
MLKFPMKFHAVQSISTAPIKNNWTGQAGDLPPLPLSIPVEFMGPGGGYSPEDLFALAVLNCVIALYKVYCAQSKISFQEVKGKAILTADKEASEASFYISHIELTIDVVGASDIKKGKELLENAIKNCPIGNSIKSCKSFHTTVS